MYKSTLEEGIIFNKEGYPDFISNVEGLTGIEKFGRWSDARLNQILNLLLKKITQNFTLNIG